MHLSALVLTASEVPASLRASAASALRLAAELVESGGDLGPLGDMVAVLDRSFHSSGSVVAAALPNLGGTSVASSRRQGGALSFAVDRTAFWTSSIVSSAACATGSR